MRTPVAPRRPPVFVWKGSSSWASSWWTWSCRVCFDSRDFRTHALALDAATEHAREHMKKQRR